ncbi:HigA family addiction module antidote protein [bacterium]|nr:HigA family addiction module antidote protein [bacterium]
MALQGYAFRPDYAIPPGETLLEVLQDLDMTQKELALRMGRPQKTINEIIKGKAAITPETALQLENVLGTPASFWGNRERQYRETLARLEAEAEVKSSVGLVDEFPVAEMVKRGWLPKCKTKPDKLRSLLSYFGVGSPTELRSFGDIRRYAFREAARGKKTGARLAWLRRGEVLGQEVECAPFSRGRFESALCSAKEMTHMQPRGFWSPLQRELAGSGVACVFIPSFPGMGLHGAARWVGTEKVLLMLSSHYKWSDQFWFSFYHEAAHILLHGKKEVFLEMEDGEDQGEVEANRWAADFLLPPDILGRLRKEGRLARQVIIDYAHEAGVAPGIVVGRLQRERRLPYRTPLNNLKTTLDWSFLESECGGKDSSGGGSPQSAAASGVKGRPV